MIRHIVTWNFKSGFNDAENRANAQKVKAELESLTAVIPGIVSLEVIVQALPSGTRDVALNSLFVSEETLAAYQVHPEHVRVSQFVGTVLTNRTCLDYVEI